MSFCSIIHGKSGILCTNIILKVTMKKNRQLKVQTAFILKDFFYYFHGYF